MANRSLVFDNSLHAYLTNIGGREPEVAARLRAETASMAEAGMQISADQGNLMAFLVELLGVRRAVEVGTFTGYSALRMAMALPEDGTLICCDVSDAYTRIGRPYWEEAGVAGRIRSAAGAGDRNPAGDDRRRRVGHDGSGVHRRRQAEL
ncbi:MAG: hypothetical protein ACMVO3_15770 [Thalassobaculum sp.]